MLKIQTVDTFQCCRLNFYVRNSVGDRISNFVYDVKGMTCELDTQKKPQRKRIYGFHAFLSEIFSKLLELFLLDLNRLILYGCIFSSC